eukprot:9629025-Alexandrium_andersonii.AAC.1
MFHAPVPTPVVKHVPTHEAARALAGLKLPQAENAAFFLEDAIAARAVRVRAGAPGPRVAQRIQ